MIRSSCSIAVCGFALLLSGCGLGGTSPKPVESAGTPVAGQSPAQAAPTPVKPPDVSRPELLSAVQLAANIQPLTAPVTMSAGRSEWVSVVLRVRTPQAGASAWLTVPNWSNGTADLRGRGAKVYQILPMPLDVNRATYVRQTGLPVAAESLPRAAAARRNDQRPH
ncbi:MAG: hypothetical protein QM754_07405 [Tepidisphaeraceae bacterium]